MESAKRVIVSTPIVELWDDHGSVNASRFRDLNDTELGEILRRGPLRFVVIDVGKRPRWLTEEDCFRFWKSEAQSHLATPDARIYLDDFPGSYCYFASEWLPASGSPIVVLEKAH